MKKATFTSFLLGATILSVVSYIPSASADYTYNLLSDAQKFNNQEATTVNSTVANGASELLIPSNTSQLKEDFVSPAFNTIDSHTGTTRTIDWTITGLEGTEKIYGPIAVTNLIYDKESKQASSNSALGGTLTIKNVGSVTNPDYKNVTVAGYITNLTPYLNSTGVDIKNQDNPSQKLTVIETPAVLAESVNLTVDNSVFANASTAAGSYAPGHNKDLGAAIALTNTTNTATTADISNSFFINNASNDHGAAIHASGSNLTLTNSTFTGNTAEGHGGAIDIEGKLSTTSTIGGDTQDKGNKFYNNTGTLGGAMFVHTPETGKQIKVDSRYNIYDANKSTASVGGGGAVYNAGTFTSTNDVYQNNTATNVGGAIGNFKSSETIDNTTTNTFKNGSITVKDSTFTANSAGAGGAIANDSVATITSNTFTGNKATSDTAGMGGAIYNFYVDGVTTNKVTSTSNTYQNNEALSGGAVFNTGNANFVSTNDTFTGNKATSTGGAMRNDGTFDINTSNTTQAAFGSNTAEKGGAIYNVGTLNINQNGGTKTIFSQNEAKGTSTTATDGNYGGAIYNVGQLKTKNVAFTNNKASDSVSAESVGGAIYNGVGATYTSTGGDTFTGNTAEKGGAIYTSGTVTLDNASTISFSGNSTTTEGMGSAIYINASTTDNPTVRGIVNINNAADTLDLDYSPYTNKTAPTTKKRLFADGEDILNAGELNINNSTLQLHHSQDLTKGVINIRGGKTGTVNINNSRIDIGKSTLYADDVTIKNNSEILTHVNAASGKEFGKISANDITLNGNNTLTIMVAAGEHFDKGSKTFDILQTPTGTTIGEEFTTITENKMYKITANGDGKYTLSRNTGDDPVVPDDPDDPNDPDDPVVPDDPDDKICPNGGCIHNAWVEEGKMEGHDKAETIQELLNEAAQRLGCDSEEYQRALSGVAPDVSPLIQAHSTEITRRLAGVISKQLYSSMERTGYIHRGKRFYKFPRKQSNLWVQALYGQSEYSAKKGFDVDTEGLAIGFDGHISPDTRLGVAYAYTTADGTAVERDTEVSSHTAMIYGEYNPNRFYTNWLALYTRSSYEEEKKVFSQTIDAEYDVDVLGAQIMLGKKMGPYVSGDWATGVISPEVGLRYTYIKQHGYTDSAGQKVSDADGQILTGILGAQYTIGYTLSPSLSWYPEFRAALTYDFIEPDMENSVALVNGSRYEVVTENMDEFGIEIGARVGLDINRKAEIALEYEGLFKGDYTNHTGLASLKYKF